MQLVSCMEFSRSFKSLSIHLFSLWFIKTQNLLRAKPGLDFLVVPLKSRNLDEVVVRPSQNLTKAAIALPGGPSMTHEPFLGRVLGRSELRACRVFSSGLLLKAKGPWLPLWGLDHQGQAPVSHLYPVKRQMSCIL